MYTRCPECETTFRLGANDLRRAQGKVRCGECEAVFNALEYLAEDAEVEQQNENEWPFVAANDAVADTIIDPAPDFSSVHGSLADAHDDSSDFEAEDEDDSENILVTESEAEAESVDAGTADTDEQEDSAAVIDDAESPGQNPYDNITDNYLLEDDDSTAAGQTGKSWGFTTTDADAADTDSKGDEAETDADADAESGASRWEPTLGDFGADNNELDTAEDPALSRDKDEPDNLDTETEWLIEDEADEDETNADEYLTEEEQEDFDDTIWERIPGVGSVADDLADGIADENEDQYISESARSYHHEPEQEADEDADWTVERADSGPTSTTATQDEQDADDLEFNAPKDKWSSIFASTATWHKDEDKAPVSFTAADESAADDSANESAAEDDAEWHSAATPESSLDSSQTLSDDSNHAAEDTAASNYDPDPAVAEHETFEQPEQNDEPAADEAEWISGTVDANLDGEDTAEEQYEPDDVPAEGYDVQHIVLHDESDSGTADEDDDAPPWQPETYVEQPEATSRSVPWVAGGLILIALLATQLVHYNRDALAASTAWGSTIRDVYAAMNIDLYPEWSVRDYEIRGSEAVAGESGQDIMDIRAQIAAIGEQATGLPYLRVVLRDRWSNPVAAQHFSPAEYAPAENLPASGLMQPNSTVSAHVSIADPGSGAQGFELELCLPKRHTGMECSGKPFK